MRLEGKEDGSGKIRIKEMQDQEKEDINGHAHIRTHKILFTLIDVHFIWVDFK